VIDEGGERIRVDDPGSSSTSPLGPEADTQANKRTRALAEAVRRNPRLPIDEKVELIQLLGGTFAWDEGWSAEGCTVTYEGTERRFPNGKAFGEWLDAEIIPNVLSGAGAGNSKE